MPRLIRSRKGSGRRFGEDDRELMVRIIHSEATTRWMDWLARSSSMVGSFGFSAGCTGFVVL